MWWKNLVVYFHGLGRFVDSDGLNCIPIFPVAKLFSPEIFCKENSGILVKSR